MLIHVWKRLEHLSLKTNARLEGKVNDANLFIAHHILTPSQYKAMGSQEDRNNTAGITL